MSSFGKYLVIVALVIVFAVIAISILIAIAPSIDDAWLFAVFGLGALAFGLAGAYFTQTRS